MTLIETNNRMAEIQKLSAYDTTQAMTALNGLLRELMENGDFYVLADPMSSQEQVEGMKFLPYILPLANTADFKALRVFSAEEAAERFAEQGEMPAPVAKLTTVDLVQLCTFWLIRGLDGFVLNDGQDVWGAVTFEQFLDCFYDEVLQRDTAKDKDFVPLLKSCRRLNKGETLILTADGELGTDGDGQCITKNDLPAPTTTFTVDGADSNGERLRMMLDILRSSEDGDDGFVTSTPSYSAEQDYPFKSVSPMLTLTAFSDSEEPEEEHSKEGEQAKTDETKPAVVHRELKLPEFAPHIKMPKLGKKTIGAFAVAGAVIVAILVAVIFWKSSSAKELRTFRDLCADESYAEAVSYYNGNRSKGFYRAADEDVDSVLRSIYSAYSKETISADAAVSALDELSAIQTAEQDANALKEGIRQLEASKAAYQKGLASSQAIIRLACWAEVMELDTKRYEQAKADVEKNSSSYLTAGLRYADALLRAERRGEAKWCYEQLAYWFEEPEVEEKLALLAGTESQAVAIDESMLNELVSKPISINRVKTSRPRSNDGAVDLYINWENTGAKTIKRVCFYATPLDAFGQVVMSKGGGQYSTFCAIEVGEYHVGEGTPSDTWVWQSAWKNAGINSARVEQVVIIFDDDTVRSIDNATTLLA